MRWEWREVDVKGGLPPKDAAKDGSVEALRRREATLHLRHHHFVLGVGGEK